MVRYTAKTRRGLALMGVVCAEVADDEQSAQATMRKWSMAQAREFAQACRWVRQEIGDVTLEPQLAAEGEGR